MAKRAFGFFADNQGSTAVVFSTCLMAIVMACGAAIDFNRVNDARTRAAAVADAAALAAVGVPDGTATTMTLAAQKYVEANLAALELEMEGTPTYSYDAAKAEFTVELNGNVGTSLLSTIGLSNVEVNARSVAIKPSVPPVEMVLALDTTGSMSGTKITALKVAAKNMVQSVMKNKDAKIGIVPFSRYVNIGVSRRNQSFFAVPADYSNQVQSCSTTYPNRTGCTTTTVNTTCTSNNDGTITTYPCTQSSTQCTSWGAPVTTCNNVTANYTFRGCIGSREAAYRNKINDSSKKYPGYLNVNCSAEILDLTTIQGHAISKINSLAASGETYLPGGLTWGWNMLTSAEPLTAAASDADLAATGGRKVLVFMTDGANTLVPTSSGPSTHGSATASVPISYANTLTADLCEKIKLDNISIYTVQFDVTDAALQQLLTNCASAPGQSYQASNAAELVTAFDKIVQDLAQIRIVQ